MKYFFWPSNTNQINRQYLDDFHMLENRGVVSRLEEELFG